MGSSRTRARTRVPCIVRRILNHCATREAPPPRLLIIASFRHSHDFISDRRGSVVCLKPCYWVLGRCRERALSGAAVIPSKHLRNFLKIFPRRKHGPYREKSPPRLSPLHPTHSVEITVRTGFLFIPLKFLYVESHVNTNMILGFPHFNTKSDTSGLPWWHSG